MNLFHYSMIGLFAAFAIADALANARKFPSIPLWRTLGLFSAILYFAIATYSPFLWDEWLGSHRLLDLTVQPFWLQFATGFLLLELGIYAWHRTMHNTPVWRVHQLHHSAERVDIWGAFYFHPLDMLGWALLGSLCLVWIVGLAPEAALAVNIVSAFASMFQHTNIATPHWLGYFVTRPESHSIHHQRGVHAFNYGDVPWFDMLFGTFRNPKRFEEQVGLVDGGSRKFGRLLSGRLIA
jgi:sterol desaturase/sphingolipid hydroxylase (fatty acid hydroxylase superfamily)